MENSEEIPAMDIVCFSDIFWDSLWQRHQQILTRFPPNWRILYIEPTSIPVLLREPKRLFARKENNIIIVSLPLIPLIDLIKSFRRINDLFILNWLRLVMKKQKFVNPVLFFYEPRFSSLIGKLNETMVVFDCIDDKLSFSNVPIWMKFYLDKLIEQADVIFAASLHLYQNFVELQKEKVIAVGNGVDVAHFKKALTNTHVPKDIQNIKKPIVGYVGVLSDWVDYDIIKSIAKKYPEFSIVLVGPEMHNVKKEIDSLKRYPNIFALGKKHYEIIPAYLGCFDICIIPFRINELTISSNPLKFYEYLAAGKKVISVNLQEIEQFDQISYIAKDRNHFVELVSVALNNSQSVDVNGAFLNEHSWDAKTKQILDVISYFLGVNHGNKS